VSILLCLRRRLLSLDTSADAGFPCDKFAILGDTIKGTLAVCTREPIYKYLLPASRNEQIHSDYSFAAKYFCLVLLIILILQKESFFFF
jgi:hypothetical protein